MVSWKIYLLESYVLLWKIFAIDLDEIEPKCPLFYELNVTQVFLYLEITIDL